MVGGNRTIHDGIVSTLFQRRFIVYDHAIDHGPRSGGCVWNVVVGENDQISSDPLKSDILCILTLHHRDGSSSPPPLKIHFFISIQSFQSVLKLSESIVLMGTAELQSMEMIRQL